MSMLESQANVIEITKLAHHPRHVRSLRAHLEEIITGKFFAGSPRCQQFLRHIVEKSIQCDFESLKERVIGIELFHRSPSYDKAEDAIVRVTASEVRKRLIKHYAQPGTASEFRICLPSGTYIPEITYTPATDSATDPSLPAEPAAESPGAAFQPATNSPSPHTSKSQYLVVVLLVALAFGAGDLWNRIGPGQMASKTPLANRTLPWSSLLHSGHMLQIVASDPDFATEQDITGHAVSLADYANERYIPDQSLRPEIRDFCLHYLRGSRVADIDLPIVTNIVSITGLSPEQFRVRTARSIRLTDFNADQDFILIGSPLSDPWVQMFSDNLDFRFVFTDKSSLQSIENAHPHANEQKIYTPQGAGFDTRPATGVSYAIIALVENPHSRGHTLILAGTGAEATEAAGQDRNRVHHASRHPAELRPLLDAPSAGF